MDLTEDMIVLTVYRYYKWPSGQWAYARVDYHYVGMVVTETGGYPARGHMAL